MASENFVIQDSIEYVYRRKNYGFSYSLYRVKKKLLALKFYFFLTLFCGAVGAAITYGSDFKPQMPGFMNGMGIEDLKNLSPDQKRALLDKYKDMGAGNMDDLKNKYEQYKDLMK
jgi:hypothetical protein